MGVSAVAGAVVGGLMQGRAASKAAKANIAQQQAALAFQEKQIQRGEKIAKESFKFGRQAALAQAEKASREAEAAIASRAYDPAGTIGLGMKRALATGASQEISRLYENIAQMRMANLQGQSFPMVTQAGPQGNWAADAARLAMQLGGGGPSSASMPAPTTAPYATYEGYGGQTYYSDPVAQQSRPLSSFPGNTASPF